MSGGFSNPIVGGGGDLVYPSIQSPNFNLTAQTGWAILKNGTAYFFNVTASGTITATAVDAGDTIIDDAGIFVYDALPANGTLLAGIAPSAGDDEFDNPYPFGVWGNSVSITDSFGNLWQFTTSGDPSTYLTLVTPNGGQLYVSQTGAIVAAEPGSPGTPETWHAPGLSNSWINTAGFAPFRYRLSAWNSVLIRGTISATSATSSTFVTLPTGYVPTQAGGAPVGATGGAPTGNAPNVRWAAGSGALAINNAAAVPTATTYFINADIPLD